MTKRVNFLLYGTLLFFFNQVRFFCCYTFCIFLSKNSLFGNCYFRQQGALILSDAVFFIFQTFGAKDPRVTHMKLLCSTQLLGWFQNAYYLDKRYLHTECSDCKTTKVKSCFEEFLTRKASFEKR